MENLKYRNLLILTVTSILLILVFTQPAWSAQIKLAWDANTASDLKSYKVYYGTVSKSYTGTVDIGDITTYTLTGLTAGQTYFIVVTAYDTSYNESVYSIEVSGVAIEVVTPGPTVPPTITPSPTPPPTPTPTPTPTPRDSYISRFWARYNELLSKFKSRGNFGRIYMASSQVETDGSFIGNLKSYALSIEEDPKTGAKVGTLLDAHATPAYDPNGQISSYSTSFWSSEIDGNKVNKGGLGELLVSRSSPRNIFTYLGESNLADPSNAFTPSNEKITNELLGLSSGDKVGREKLIKYVHGYDLHNSSEKRKWILGAIINSRPLVVPYEDARSVIFVGANDGMLHAFDDATGEELWSFIPDDLLGGLKHILKGRGLKYFVDASPKAYTGGSQKILLFGLRRGGSHYYALDVTDPEKPKFLWKIGSETKDYSEIGQSWSTPQIGKIKYKTGEKVVCFIGGGYDENQDKNILMTPDTKGRAVYVVDLFTGAQLWRWDYERDPGMKYSIPSDISQVDTDGNGYIDRLYVGDTGGRLWRFDMNNPNPKSWSGRILLNTQAEATVNTRKFFCRPDVTLEDGYEMVFFGTGDREHPNETKMINKFYALRDIGVISTFSEKDLVDVTKGTAAVQDFDNKKGWFISLEGGKGEKVFAPPVVLFKVVYFSTFSPPTEKDDPNGIARIYALDYQNGGPILNLNPANDIEKVKIDLSDRSTIIGTGVPSGTVLSVLNGKLVGFTGFQGGVYNTPLKKNSTIIPIWWREVSKK